MATGSAARKPRGEIVPLTRQVGGTGRGRRKATVADPQVADIIQTLYSEHRHFESLLETLEQETFKLTPGKIPDYHLMRDAIDYLKHYPDEYHHPREDVLFRALLKSDGNFTDRLERLEREHETLRYYNDSLHEELSRIAEGAPVDRTELREGILRYVAGYRQHMAYESEEIFPSARGTLSPDDLKRLGKLTRHLDDPLFGHTVLQQYHRLQRSLRKGIAAFEGALVATEVTGIESAISKVAGHVERLQTLSKNLPVPDLRRARKTLNPLTAWLRRGRSPSWQARVMNACSRAIVKPMMLLGSVESMREMTGRMDAQREKSQAEDIRVRAVSEEDYKGEWVNIVGARPRRVLLYFPGGGFVMRTRIGHRSFVARICRAAGVKTLLVHYRLAPECPFPGGLEDCLAAYHDLLRQGHDPADITIAGDSAGGGLVLSTLLALRDEGSPMPASAIVLSPLADLTYSGVSRKFNKHRDPMLPNHRASHMHELYMGAATPRDRYLSPVLADFSGLPPMLGQVGSTEILLDDTVRAALQADKAGVPFYLEIWREMPHVFPMFGMLPESEVAVERIAEFMTHGSLGPLPDRYGGSDKNRGRPRWARL